MWPHRRQPARLPLPWDSPGKNTGGGCHFLLQCMKVKSESEVTQSCPTFSDPMDCSPPGSSVHGIFQARALEWGAIAFSEISLVGWCKAQKVLDALWYWWAVDSASPFLILHKSKSLWVLPSNDLFMKNKDAVLSLPENLSWNHIDGLTVLIHTFSIP